MVSESAINLVRSAVKGGKTENDIVDLLREADYSEFDIAQTIAALRDEIPRTQIGLPRKRLEDMPELPRKGTSPIWLAVVILAGLGIIVGSVIFLANQQTSSGCENMQCFIAAAKTCSNTNITWVRTVQMTSVYLTGISYMELQGMENDRCRIYVITKSEQVAFTNETIAQMLADNLTMDEIIAREENSTTLANESTYGLDSTCTVEPQRLADLLTAWTAGQSSADDFSGVDCIGALANTTGFAYLPIVDGVNISQG